MVPVFATPSTVAGHGWVVPSHTEFATTATVDQTEDEPWDVTPNWENFKKAVSEIPTAFMVNLEEKVKGLMQDHGAVPRVLADDLTVAIQGDEDTPLQDVFAHFTEIADLTGKYLADMGAKIAKGKCSGSRKVRQMADS